MIKAVIFDLDGVLTSTDNLHTKAWGTACELWGIPFSGDVAQKLRGISRLESADIILKEGECQLSYEEKLIFTNKKNEIYKEYLSNLSSSDISPGVKETVDFLRQNGILVAVASSSKNAVTILKRIGLYYTFPVIIDGEMIQKSKPDPEVFQKAVESLGLFADECLVVEDAASGILAAKSLGCLTAGIGLEATKAGADFIIHNLIELIELSYERSVIRLP